MSEKTAEPYELIETKLNNMLDEVSNDFSSIIEYLEGLLSTFSEFEENSQMIDTNLNSANVPDCFSSAVGLVTELAQNTAKNLFFESTFETGLEQLKNAYSNYLSVVKNKIDVISQLFQNNRSKIQNLVKLNESKNDHISCVQFQKCLVDFMENYDFFQTNTNIIINQCISLSNKAVKQIEDGVNLTMSLLIGKFSLYTDFQDISIDLNSVDELNQTIKETFNFNYTYNQYIAQNSLLDSKKVSFLNPESIDGIYTKLKISLKEMTDGFKKDEPIGAPNSQVSLNQGQEGEIISFNGYSDYWLVNFTNQGQLYVNSNLLDISIEKS